MPRRHIAAILMLVSLAGCMTDQPDPDDPLGRTPAELEAERAACTADGGDFRSAGIGILTCIRPTPDAGKTCTRAGDCAGACVAEAESAVGACSPVTPIFGCFSLFDDAGERVEICVD